MTVKELKKNYKEKNPNGKFFDKSWLIFFGESLRTMKVSRKIVDFQGHKCYELCTFQKNRLEQPFHKYYFDCKTFEYIIEKG